uniref:DUF4587 domain-containing protein n=1 Tax=Pavo cristatus TaxID=9049 RepID=A0A8C9ET59_PAVCR
MATAHPTRSPHLRGGADASAPLIPSPRSDPSLTQRLFCSPADLFELMMIQNSQMHQVVMNSLAVSALVSFGFGPSPATAQVRGGTDGCPPPSDLLGVLGGALAQPEGRGTTPGGHSLLSSSLSISPVPPPPPPSATGTVGANVPPASGNTFSP